MPTPHPIPITPGTLCWLRSSIPENNDAIVTTVSCLGVAGGSYGIWKGHKIWTIVSKQPLAMANGRIITRIVQPGGLAKGPESCLVPIAGPGLADHVENFDSNSQPETIGQLLRDAGLAIRPQRKPVTER